MKTKDVDTIIKLSGISALGALILGTFWMNFMSGVGLFFGMVWGSVNLYLLKELTINYLSSRRRFSFKLVLLMLLKFPLLYLLGFELLKSTYWPLTSVLVGLSFSFGLIIVMSLVKGFREGRLI